MSEAIAGTMPVDVPPPESRMRRILKVGAAIVAVIVAVAFLHLIGVDVGGWFTDLWDQISDLQAKTIVGGVTVQSPQTALAGISYYGILRSAYPGEVRIAPIVTAYAVGVAMNGFLPANIGTFVTLLMFVAIIPSATFGGAIAAYLVQKIFFTIAGTFVYLYLFLSVPGSFDLNLGGLKDHPVSVIVILVGGAILIVMLGRIFWQQGEEALGPGEAGRRDPLAPGAVPAPRVPPLLPLLAVQARRDRDLPRRVRDPGHVRVGHVGGRAPGRSRTSSSVTPGAAGITQATNALALDTCCDVPTDTAVAYSTAQQLIITAWNVLFATVLVVIVFGWTGGKQLVGAHTPTPRNGQPT